MTELEVATLIGTYDCLREHGRTVETHEDNWPAATSATLRLAVDGDVCSIHFTRTTGMTYTLVTVTNGGRNYHMHYCVYTDDPGCFKKLVRDISAIDWAKYPEQLAEQTRKMKEKYALKCGNQQ